MIGWRSVRLLVLVSGSDSASEKRLARENLLSFAWRFHRTGCRGPRRIRTTLVIVLLWLTASVAQAGTFTVNNFADFQNALQSIALDPANDHTININANITMTSW